MCFRTTRWRILPRLGPRCLRRKHGLKAARRNHAKHQPRLSAVSYKVQSNISQSTCPTCPPYHTRCVQISLKARAPHVRRIIQGTTNQSSCVTARGPSCSESTRSPVRGGGVPLFCLGRGVALSCLEDTPILSGGTTILSRGYPNPVWGGGIPLAWYTYPPQQIPVKTLPSLVQRMRDAQALVAPSPPPFTPSPSQNMDPSWPVCQLTFIPKAWVLIGQCLTPPPPPKHGPWLTCMSANLHPQSMGSGWPVYHPPPPRKAWTMVGEERNGHYDSCRFQESAVFIWYTTFECLHFSRFTF